LEGVWLARGPQELQATAMSEATGTYVDTATMLPVTSSPAASFGPGPGHARSGEARNCLAPGCLIPCAVTEKPLTHTFVGTGNGGYHRETHYKYVGIDAGDFEFQRVYPFNIKARLFFFLGGACLLVPVAVVTLLLWLRAGSAAADSSAVLPDVDIARERSARSYNCTYQRESWEEVWSPHKKAWCCLYRRFGCDRAFPTRHNCDLDFLDWVRQWSKAKQVWCCLHARRGCPTAPPHSTTSPPFYCAVGFSNWQLGWSESKMQWCCDHEGRGCRAEVTTPAPSEVEFDCNADRPNWRHGWSDMKAEWCCKRHSVGCNASESFDCEQGLSAWRSNWTDSKKDWCCEHRRKGCTDKGDRGPSNSTAAG